MTRVAVAFSQARQSRLDGVQATIRPLRFPDGSRTQSGPRGTWAMPRVVVRGVEALYVVEFRLPRFLCLPFEERMATVVHEMYHVSPSFDGALRRFDGGRPFHAGSRERYHALMLSIARAYLARTQRPELHAFLRQSFKELLDAHGGVVGMRFRSLRPRRIS
jgi:predicted metallopeptidase